MARELTVYLLLDSRGIPIAQGRLEGSADGPNWQIRVLDDKVNLVLQHKTLKLMSVNDGNPSYEGTLMRSRNDMIQLEVHRITDKPEDMRQNLRVAVRFNSLIYPISGRWKGRRAVESKDLSCGGVAFYCPDSLRIGERIEFVVPVTSQPVLVTAQILRSNPNEREGTVMYAAKFLDLCNDEEMIIREAVFSLQLRSPPRQTWIGSSV